MKYLIPIIICAVIFSASSGYAKPHNAPVANAFELDSMFLRPDGAITTWTTGGVIDPYFPTKALLLADDNGMNINEIGIHWVEWMLKHQDEAGLFDRYCLKDDQVTYTTCSAADADDSMMAMWIELLYRLAPRGGLPEAWAKSAQKAQYQLDRIFDAKNHVFVISEAMPVGLLMDNIEVYAAYKSIERNAIRLADNKTAADYRARAEYLKNGMVPTFWDPKTKTYKASTQDRKERTFYPDAVVQLIPMMYDFTSTSIQAPPDLYKKWMNDYGDEWFALIGKDYPWGLLAVLALDKSDTMRANCWLQKAAPTRQSPQWNVLDEAAFEIVDRRLRAKNNGDLPVCKMPKKAEKKPAKKKSRKKA